MNKKKPILTLLLSLLLFTMVMTTGVGATVATNSITPTSTPNYTLYYNSMNGKMYTDQAMGQVYTDQSGKWSTVYDSQKNAYTLILNNFKFETSARIALSLPYDTVIQLQAGSTNEITSEIFLGNNSPFGIFSNGDLTIYSTGDGSGVLSVSSGTATGIDGYYSRGIHVADNLQILSGHLFVSSGGDNNSIGVEAATVDFYNGEFGTYGHNLGLAFIQSQTNHLNFVDGTAIYGGSGDGNNALLDIDSGDADIAQLLTYRNVHILYQYLDVPYDAWYAKAVLSLVENGFVNGYPNGDGQTYKINPGNTITRAEFVAILARLYYSEDELNQFAGNFTFTDVPGWASKYVGWATNSGFVKGYDGTTFGSGDNISREQMASILNRIVTQKNLTSSVIKTAITFTDTNDIATYAKDAVTNMQKAGVINGYDNGNSTYRFNPKGQATRAEAFTMINNFLTAYGD